MRCVLQRVTSASVSVDGQIVGQIGRGVVVFVGVAEGDVLADIEYVASKIRDLRLFGDDQRRMNRSMVEPGGAALLVSQFTLLGDVRKGRRPGFDAAAAPVAARRQYEELIARLRTMEPPVQKGGFQA